MVRRNLVPLALAALFVLPLTSSGQALPEAVAGLKTKNSLSADESNQLKTWLDESGRAVGGADVAAAAEAMRLMRSAADGGTPAYREALTKAILEVVRAGLTRAEADGAARLATLASLTDSAEASAVLAEALKDERPAVRAAAAFGLKRLRTRIGQAGGEFFSRTLARLVEAGKKETSRYTLEAIYQAMDYTQAAGAGNQRDVTKALLDVLEERAKAADSDRLPAEGGDLAAIRALGKQAKSLEPNPARQFGTILARFLRYNVQLYTVGGGPGEPPLRTVKDDDSREMADRRNAAEQTIIECENILNTIHGPDPERAITPKMRAADFTGMKIGFESWARLFNDKYALALKLKAETEGA